MSEEYNIFKNLDEFTNSNLLDQLKSLNPAETDDSQVLDDSFDIDSLVLDYNAKKSPSKKRSHEGNSATTEKKSNEVQKPPRSTILRDASISPTLPLFHNLSKDIDQMPAGARTRSSTQEGACRTARETNAMSENIRPLPLNNRKSRGSSGRGRDRSRGRGRGRKHGSNSLNGSLVSSHGLQNDGCQDNSTQLPSNGWSASAQGSTINTDTALSQRSSGRLRGRRSRQRHLAEVAARCVPVDTIDLVNSPLVRVEGFVDLSSGEEEETRTTRSKKKKQTKKNASVGQNKNKSATTDNNPLDISYDDDNPVLNIKVNWKGKPETFKLRKYQTFSEMFKKIAERENINMENIVFNLNDRIIMADDTPDSIDYKIFNFIEGRELSNAFNSSSIGNTAGKKRDANQIALKIQSNVWKRPLQITIKKADTFRILYIKCAEEIKVPLNQLKLSFDGELLQLNDTPADLDLEGGEAIDIYIKE